MALPPKIESRTGVRAPAHVVWDAVLVALQDGKDGEIETVERRR